MTDPQLPPPVPQAPAFHPPAAPSHQTPPMPTYQAPPGAYPAPIGGYAASAGPYAPSGPPPQKSPTLGIVAFALSVVAAVVAPLLVGIAGYQIGFTLPSVMSSISSTTDDLSFLSPVRDQVLMGELSFWGGTVAGIAAVVLGIVAIVKRKGRGWAITALIVGVVAPAIFFVVLSVMIGIGASSGAVAFYSA